MQQANRVRQALNLRQVDSGRDGVQLLHVRPDSACPCPSPQGIKIGVLWKCKDSLEIILQNLSGMHARMLCTLSKGLLLDSAGIICPASLRPSSGYLQRQGFQKVATAAQRCTFVHLDLSLVRGQQAWELVLQAVLPHCHMLQELSVSTEILCLHRSGDLIKCVGLPLVTTLRVRDDALFAPNLSLHNGLWYKWPPRGIALPPGRRQNARPPFAELEAELLHLIGIMPKLCNLDLTRTILGPDQLRRLMIGWNSRQYSLVLDGCFAHLLGGIGHSVDTNTTSETVSVFLMQVQRRVRWIPWSALNALSLAYNSLGDRCINDLRTHLQSARNLKSLNLSYNHVTDSGSHVLSCNFRFLQSLESLNLSGNLLTSKGTEYLCAGAQSVDFLLLLDITLNHVDPQKVHQLSRTWNQARFVFPSRKLWVHTKSPHRAASADGDLHLHVYEQIEPWS